MLRPLLTLATSVLLLLLSGGLPRGTQAVIEPIYTLPFLVPSVSNVISPHATPATKVLTTRWVSKEPGGNTSWRLAADPPLILRTL